jgi:hypothetical protein
LTPWPPGHAPIGSHERTRGADHATILFAEADSGRKRAKSALRNQVITGTSLLPQVCGLLLDQEPPAYLSTTFQLTPSAKFCLNEAPPPLDWQADLTVLGAGVSGRALRLFD